MINFLDINNDPTTPIDLNGISLEQQYSNLTDKEKNLIAAKLLGMNHLPVDINTFLQDPYFLGDPKITNQGKSIFKIWYDKLNEIFPSPIINRYPYISFSGCIGSGKSAASKFMALYHYHKLDCCSNVFTSLGLAGGTKLAMGFFHASSDTAYRDFVQYFKTVMDISPYFRNLYNNPPIRFISSGPKATGSVIGTQLIYTVLSEIGFWKSNDARDKINEVITRYNSRFVSKRFYFGGVVCDSSAKDAESGATELFESSVYSNELFSIAPSHWEARPELYKESKGVTFNFYKGDSKSLPRVIEDKEDLSKFDKDRIIKVPIQAKFMFINDPIRSLNDLAGIPYTAKDLFFNGDLSNLLACSKIKNEAPETIEVDFYDKDDRIIKYVQTMIDRIPCGTSLTLHYDIGLKKDKCGVALCYYTGDISDGTTSYPTFRIPLMFLVSRRKGQSTSLDHLYQFIKDLISQSYYVTFSADSFASAGIFQSCERDGIPYRSLSIDKTPDAAYMFKNVVTSRRIEMPYHNTLLRECSELRVLNNGQKIDHPIVSSCTEFDYKNAPSGTLPGSKDLFDAVAGALMSCYKMYSENMELGYYTGYSKQAQAISKITKNSKEESYKTFQGMIEEIF